MFSFVYVIARQRSEHFTYCLVKYAAVAAYTNILISRLVCTTVNSQLFQLHTVHIYVLYIYCTYIYFIFICIPGSSVWYKRYLVWGEKGAPRSFEVLENCLRWCAFCSVMFIPIHLRWVWGGWFNCIETCLQCFIQYINYILYTMYIKHRTWKRPLSENARKIEPSESDSHKSIYRNQCQDT